MKNFNTLLSRTGLCLFVAGTLSFSSLALSAYVPFPGKHKVRLINVEAANVVSVNFETWPGFGDMEMETSADMDIVTAVYTDKGRLGQALKKKGYARSASVDPKKPWCK